MAILSAFFASDELMFAFLEQVLYFYNFSLGWAAE